MDVSEADTYTLHQPVNLPLDLAMLDEGNNEQILAFVRRYGLLWHGPDNLQTDTRQLRESMRDWERVVAVLGNTINFYITLRRAENGDPRNILRNSASSASPLFARAFRRRLAAEEKQQWTDENYLNLGNELLAAWLDDKVRGCTLGVVPVAEQDARDHPGQVLLTYRPSDLETAAYTELAMLIAGQQELRRCKGCGRWFLPTSSKNLYHDPSCATNARQRRRRQRQSGGTEAN